MVFPEHYTSFYLDTLPHWAHAPSTGVRDNCNGRGGPLLATVRSMAKTTMETVGGGALATGALDGNDKKGNGRGGPELATGSLDGNDNNGNGWGGPALATDALDGNNRNGDVQGEGHCGGDGSGGGGGENVVGDNDDDSGGGNNDENGRRRQRQR
jgi:hypothetical protein